MSSVNNVYGKWKLKVIEDSQPDLIVFNSEDEEEVSGLSFIINENNIKEQPKVVEKKGEEEEIKMLAELEIKVEEKLPSGKVITHYFKDKLYL